MKLSPSIIRSISSKALWGGMPLLAQAKVDLDEQLTRSPGELSDPSQAFGLLGNLFSNMLTLALLGGAITTFTFFVIGAIQWGMAGSGDGAAKGRRTMLYAVIGMAMLALVYIVIMLYNAVLPSAQ